ncbi:MAG TPA: WecB/TagA/CpsF family glycosyltransferase [Pseudacidobacterium sp.]|jgi:N-acetylglucosaminyldiphosphoundecaprenol N-acetyl-beta-D-mannosaminyltransferase|nr:WecB/TagA/CpsF family glycosyltransferase [Pseudacidobacterium sp.]
MRPESHRPAANVLGVDIDAIDMERALNHISAVLQSSRKGYICVAGVHGVMEAQRSEELFQAYIGSEMTIPDGMPLVWVGRVQGHASMQRVTGPDLMREVFHRKEFANVTHFFYGGRPGIADELREKLNEQFPHARIVGSYTPPFRDLSSSEQEEFAAIIRKLKPDITWVGISCPRQELFMASQLSGLETKLMFGVGAAFDYHTGHIRDCAEWIKRAGLQWLHRLAQDPSRLWRRYLRNNPAFLWRIACQLCGLRRYPIRQGVRYFPDLVSTSQTRSNMAHTVVKKQEGNMSGCA